MSRRKGKNRKKYPIQLRLLAVLMAVVMVVSVITITNKRDKVKAGGGVITANMTDSNDALKGKVSGTFTVHIPVVGFRFKLDSSGESVETPEVTEFEIWKKTKKTDNTDVTYIAKSDVPDPVPADSEYDYEKALDAVETKNIETVWTGSVTEEDGNKYIISNSSTATATLTKSETYEYADKDSGAALDAAYDSAYTKKTDTSTTVATINVVSYSMSELSVDINNGTHEVSITGADENTNSDTEVYYFTPSFEIEGLGTYATSAEVKAALKADTTADGTYTVNKYVTTADGQEIKDGENPWKVSTASATKNFTVLTGTSASVDGAAVGTNDGKNITITGTSPVKDIVVAFTTDGKANSSVTSPAGGSTASTVSGSEGNYSFTIPGSKSLNNKSGLKYTVNITDDADSTATASFDVTVSYLDGTPVVAIENENVGFTNDTNFKLLTNITAGSADKISQVIINHNGTDKPMGETNIGKTEYPITLVEGSNTFKVKAQSNFTDTPSNEATFGIFCDIKKPEITSIKASQVTNSENGGDGTITNNDGNGTIDFPNKVTNAEKVTLEFNVKENPVGNASDFASITVDGETVTADGSGKCIKDIDMTNASNVKTVKIVLTDKAGNVQNYDVTLNIHNDIAIIDSVFTPSELTADGMYKKATVEYTIKSQVEYKEAEINGNPVTVSGGSKSGEYYIYTYKYVVDPAPTKEYGGIFLKFKNKNGVVSEDQIKIKSIDLGNDLDVAAAGSTTWTQKVVLYVIAPAGKVTATGTNKSTYTSDGTEPIMAEVKESKDSKGTKVSFKSGELEWEGTFYVDSTRPEINTFHVGLRDVSNSKLSYFSGDPAITYNIEDNISGWAETDGIIVKINEKEYKDVKSKQKLSEIIGKIDESKIYNITFTVKDKAGNETSTSGKFKVDNSAPTVRYDVSDSSGNTKETIYESVYYSGDTSVKMTIKDANLSGLTKAQFLKYISSMKINGEAVNPGDYDWNETSGAWVARDVVAGDEEGTYLYEITVSDPSKNDTTRTRKFIVDSTNPALSFNVDGSNYDIDDPSDTQYFNKSFLVVAKASDKNIDDDTYDLEYLYSTLAGEESEETETVDGTKLKIVEDGIYELTFTASDRAGNESEKTIYVGRDTVVPAHNLYVKTDNPAKFADYKNHYINKTGKFANKRENYEYGLYFDSSVQVEVGIVEDTLSKYEIYDTYSSTTSPILTETIDNAADTNRYTKEVTLSGEGEHILYLVSEDLAGNKTIDTDSAKRIRVYIDSTDPDITTILNGENYTEGSGIRYLKSDGTITVSVNDTYKDANDLTRISSMSPPGSGTSVVQNKISEGTESFTSEADYEVQYTAVDLSGRKSATRHVNFRVDKTAPELTITGPASSTTKTTVTLNIKEAFYADMPAAKYTVYMKKDGEGERQIKSEEFAPRSSSDSITFTFDEDAEYRIEFSAEDKTGNTSKTSYSLIQDATAPKIELGGVSNYDMTDQNVSLKVTVEEAFYSKNKIVMTGTRKDIDGNIETLDLDPSKFAGTTIKSMEEVFDKDGIYDIQITSTDGAGNSSSKDIHFTIDKTNPSLGDISKYDGKIFKEFKWDLGSPDSLAKDLTVCDVKLYIDGVLYDGDSPVDDGSHVLRIEATDEMGNTEFKEAKFIVDSKNPTIIVTGVEDKAKLETATNVTVSVQLDEDTLTSVKLNGAEIAINDNEASFTVDTKGKYKLEATAKDQAENEASIAYEFSFGKAASVNWLLIAIIAVIAILLIIGILALIARRNRS